MQPREPEQSLVEWNRQFENDLAAVDRAIARERQAALDAGKPWPPERKTLEPSPDPDAGARRVIAERQRDGYVSHITTTEPKAAAEPGRQPAPEHVSELENEAGASGSSRPEAISRQPEPEPHKNLPLTSASQVTALPGWTNSRLVRTRPRYASPPRRPSSRPAPSTSRESSARRRPSLSLTGSQSGTTLRWRCSGPLRPTRWRCWRLASTAAWAGGMIAGFRGGLEGPVPQLPLCGRTWG